MTMILKDNMKRLFFQWRLLQPDATIWRTTLQSKLSWLWWCFENNRKGKLYEAECMFLNVTRRSRSDDRQWRRRRLRQRQNDEDKNDEDENDEDENDEDEDEDVDDDGDES